jgi:plastocyanin
MRVRSALLVASLSALLALSACGGGDDAASTTDGGSAETTKPAAEGPDLTDVDWKDETGQTEVDVVARDNTFVAQYIEVSPGTTVTWTNRGRTEHNVLPAIDGSFEGIETADLEPTESASITFEEPGDYPYFCSLHGTKTKGMIGGVRVVEG